MARKWLVCALAFALADGSVLGPSCRVSRAVNIRMGGGFASAKGKKASKKATQDVPAAPTGASASAPTPQRYELPAGTQFMGGWIIDPQICDGLVSVFEDSPEMQTQGMISMQGG